MAERFAYYERVPWGLIDHDADTDDVVDIEIWSASKRLPAGGVSFQPAQGGYFSTGLDSHSVLLAARSGLASAHP